MIRLARATAAPVTTAMHPDTHRRIVNAKYVLERAGRIQAENAEMSIAISLLLMHDAVELVMQAVCDDLGIAKKFEFMGFWSAIKETGRPLPPDHVPMEMLNRLRVGLKHSGVPRTRGFFENVLKAYCNVDYSAVSLIDLVADPEVRTLLNDSQAKFASGDQQGALTSLRLALHQIEHPKGKRLPLIQSPDKPRVPAEMARNGWDQYFSQLHSFLGQCASRMNDVTLGIDPVRRATLVRSTPHLQWSVSGHYTVIQNVSSAKVSEAHFDDMLDFLIDYALKASEAYIAD
jgi:hypothetical protein